MIEDIENAEKWLDENLKKSFRPHLDSIPNSKSKGIYFWFMKEEGYIQLSKYVEIKPLNSCYSKEIEGLKYDLVYLGTTGTGKTGKSNLYKRLDWHINQKHRNSTINQKQSALSTLRTGLGALLAEDLIELNTEELVNQFMKEYFVIYFTEYPDNKSLIDNHEAILIEGLKPLLNIKSNSNAKKDSVNNSTKFYKKRRNEVEKRTKKRLQGSYYNTEKVIGIQKSSKQKLIKSKADIFESSIEKEFSKAQEIHHFFRKQKFEQGDWHILIYETRNSSNLLLDNWNRTKIPHKYFGNTETNKSKMINNKQVARWKIIEKEMLDSNIDSLTIKFYKLKK
jgi:hypothetical protein